MDSKELALLPSPTPFKSYSAQKSPTYTRRFVVLSIALVILYRFTCTSYIPLPTPEPRPPTLPGWPPKLNPSYLIKAKHGAVATENKLCSDIGVDVLKDGGNAVDAAVAATLCVGVVGMMSSGIGGGGFMTVRIPPEQQGGSSEAWTVDFRETAPAAANKTMFARDPFSSMFGGLSVGVPGELRGLDEAHRRWGTLKWKRLVEPSARLAEGWIVQTELARRIRTPLYTDLMLNNPDWSQVFAPNGELLREGDMIKRTALARTLYTIADQGAEAFYREPILSSLIRKVRSAGGILTHEDFLSYKPIVEPALQGTYKNRTVYTTHAPTSGPALLHMLNLHEKFNDEETVEPGLRLHRIVEILKFGFAARTRLCDPAFANGSIRIDTIPTKEFADMIFPNITDDRTHTADYYRPETDIKSDHGTSHTSIVDSDGMAVSITSTINLVFGSQVLDPETGVILNDEMDDFSQPGIPNAFGLWPSPYNYPEPHKRPLSSIAPTIIEHTSSPDGGVHLVLGGSGGSRIFGAVFQTILGAELHGIGAAVEAPRAHDQLFPALVDADSTFGAAELRALLNRGHNVSVADINRIAAVVNAISVDKNGDIFAASDSRKNGIAAGY